MNKRMTLAGLALAALVAQPAFAGQTWSFQNTPNSVCGRTENLGNSVTCNGGATNATLTGWGTTGGAGTTFAAAYLNNQGDNGLGLQSQVGTGASASLESTNSPYHAFDSIDNTELVAIQFSSAISLSQVTLGWASTDADFSLLAWTGAGTPTLSTAIGGKTAANLVGNGWSLVGMYSVAGNANPDVDITVDVNTTNNTTSSYWLIGAFNSAYGGPAVDSTGDAWKLLSVAANGTGGRAGVPEPGSLALVGVALLGAFGARRMKAATKAASAAA